MTHTLQSGTYTFTSSSNPQLDVKVELRSSSKIDIFVYVNAELSRPAITLFISLLSNSAIVNDLYGAMPGTKWHRKGLGALAVNTAIQFLKAIYPPTTTVGGHVFDAKDYELPEQDRPKRQEDRKAFWRTFGFGISQPDLRGDEFLCGTVSELRVATIGSALGVHPRAFDISKMQFFPIGV